MKRTICVALAAMLLLSLYGCGASDGATKATTKAQKDEKLARYEQAEELQEQGRLTEAAIAFGKLGDYQDARERSFSLWNEIPKEGTISAGRTCTAAVKNDGTVMITGELTNGTFQLDSAWTDITAVSVEVAEVLGLKSDGTVVAHIDLDLGQGAVTEWTDIVSICAGGGYAVGLKSDGTVLVAGQPSGNADEASGWTDITFIHAGSWGVVGLKADGTVLNTYFDLSDWTNIQQIQCGSYGFLGLRPDGTVLATGIDAGKRTFMENWICEAREWTDIVAVDIGSYVAAGLKADGTVVIVYPPAYAEYYDVSGWTDVVSISAGHSYVVGLKSDGTMLVSGYDNKGETAVHDWSDIKLPE